MHNSKDTDNRRVAYAPIAVIYMVRKLFWPSNDTFSEGLKRSPRLFKAIKKGNLKRRKYKVWIFLCLGYSRWLTSEHVSVVCPRWRDGTYTNNYRYIGLNKCSSERTVAVAAQLSWHTHIPVSIVTIGLFGMEQNRLSITNGHNARRPTGLLRFFFFRLTSA